MRIEAIYNDGKLELPDHIKLRHRRFALKVEIPESEIESAVIQHPETTASDPDVSTSHETGIGARLNEILGPLRGNLDSITADEANKIWREHLEEKYLGRR